MDLTELTLNLTSVSNGTTTETPLGLASSIFGWTYALCWSSELYIRMFAWSQFTWQRFALYQFMGYIEYSLFNLIFVWNGGAEIVYSNLFPNGRIPVETYDAIYSCHYILFLFFVLVGHCLRITGHHRQSTYAILNSGQEDEGDSVSALVRITAIWFTIGLTAFSLIMCLAGQFNWIVFYILLSYPILIMAWVEVIYFVKYYDDLEVSSSPAIVSIFALHCAGGVACITQMICTGANYDWYLFIGNLPKFGLALAAIVYTIAFLLMSRRNPLDFIGNDAEAGSYGQNNDERIASLRRQAREYYRLGDFVQTIKAYEALYKLVVADEKTMISKYLKVIKQLKNKITTAKALFAGQKYLDARNAFLKCEALLAGSFPVELSNNFTASELAKYIALTHQHEGNLHLAIPKYLEAILQNPRNYEALFQLGKARFIQRDYDNSILNLKEALKLSKTDQYEIQAMITDIDTKLKSQREAQNRQRQEKYWKEYAANQNKQEQKRPNYNTDRQEQQNRAREQQQQEYRNRQEQERKEQEKRYRQEQERKEQEKRGRHEQARKQKEQDNAREELRRKQQKQSNAKPKDNYEILGISRTATANQIREAFREKLKMYHPDKHPDPELKEYFTEETEKLIKAYNAVTSTFKR